MLWSEYQKFVLVWNKLSHNFYKLSPIETFDGDVVGKWLKFMMRELTYLSEKHRASHIFIDIFSFRLCGHYDLGILYKSMKKIVD